jgi:hypothetical protein
VASQRFHVRASREKGDETHVRERERERERERKKRETRF